MRIGLCQSYRRILPHRPHYRPVGLAYLTSHIRRRYPDVEVVFRDDPLDLLDLEPDLIGIFATSCFFSEVTGLARKFKRSSRAPIVLGGPHISSLWQTLPRNVDVGVLGEGEITFEEIVAIFLAHGRLPASELGGVKGIVCWRDAELCKTADRGMIEDLDTLAIPDRTIFPDDAPTYLVSSRGCPYQCAFCSPKTIWKGIRMHTASRVLEEIEDILPVVARNRETSYQGFSVIAFQDDLFAARKDRLADIARGTCEMGLGDRVGFGGTVQALSFDAEVARLLKQMGVVRVTFGAESGSDPILKFLKGPASSVEKNQRLIDLCAEVGISVACSFIVGAPGESLEDMGRTYEFIHRNREKIGVVEVVPLMPFPGTRMWKYAEERGLVSPDMDWSRIDMMTTSCSEERMVYLNDQVPFKKFLATLRKFAELRNSINKAAETLPDDVDGCALEIPAARP